MTKRRKGKIIVELNGEGKVVAIQDFKSVNAAKRANRGNMTAGFAKGEKLPPFEKDAGMVEEAVINAA